MEEVAVTWGRVARVWWLFAWRGAVGGLVLGFISGLLLGVVIGVIGASVGWPREIVQRYTATAGGLAGVVVGLVWSLIVLRMALRKQYDDFRLALIRRS
jgi:hypothetical protein